MRIGVDMDGVLADFTSAALRNAKAIWDITVSTEMLESPRMTEYIYENFLSKEQRKKYSDPRQMYTEMCPPGFFEHLDPYNGAVETFKHLCKTHDVTIVTKPLGWGQCPGEKVRWLNNHLGPQKETGYQVILVGSTEAKGIVDVDVMIDDDPRVIRSLKYSTGLMIRRPWNRDYLKFAAVHAIDDFTEVPSALDEMTKGILMMNEED